MSRSHPSRQRKAFDVWQIVYIDLMTNVMIFFVILWAVQNAPKKKAGISETVGTETVKTVDLPGDVLFPVAKSEISRYGASVADHVVLCTHADNTPARDVPAFTGNLTPAEESAINEAKAKNRRIVIEDKLISRTLPGTP